MINQILRNIKLFYLAQLYAWKNQFAYRLQALIYWIYFALNTLVTYIFITVIYGVSMGIPGWSYAQMLLLSASAIILVGLVNVIVDIPGMSQTLMSGGFDVMLARPVSSLMTAFSNFNSAGYASSVAGGIILFSYAASLLNLGIFQLAIFVPLFLIGVIIVALFITMLLLCSYRLFRGGTAINWLFNTLGSVSKYPLSIYGVFGSLIFTFIIPLGLATYYPVEAITGKLSAIQIVLLGLVGIVLVLILLEIVRRLFRGYASGMG